MSKKRISGFREWSVHSANMEIGCPHGCLYGFCGATAIRFGQATPENWTHPRPMKNPSWKKFTKKVEGRIAFPSTHDITPMNIDRYLVAAESILGAGNELLIVSKPHLECIDRLTKCLEPYKYQILFRFTIGSLRAEDLEYWEPGAPDKVERLESLKMAFYRGFKTSVSCEPLLTLSIGDVLNMVAVFRPFVTDSVWIGRANKLKLRVAFNRPGDGLARAKAEMLEDKWCDDNIRLLYGELKDDPIVKWKDSVKEIMGLPAQEKAGEDI